MTPITIEQFDSATLELFETAAAQAIAGATTYGIKIAPTEIKVLLAQSIAAQFPAVPDLISNASVAMILVREQAIATRATFGQVNATMEQQLQEGYAAWMKELTNIAGVTAKALAGLLGGLALKSIAGL